MKREGIALCLLIAAPVVYFDLIFYNGFEMTEQCGSQIQKILFGIDSSTAIA